MAATISGIVFNDVNSSGSYTAGEPGISGAYVVLYTTITGTCISTQSDINGNYSFTNITIPGEYRIYETVTNPAGDTCPPTIFTQPTGFNDSTTKRQIIKTVTPANISGNTNISGNNFGHDNKANFGCTGDAIQSSAASIYYIDLISGSEVLFGTTSGPLNAIGYNVTDGNLWSGYNGLQRLTPDMKLLTFSIPNLPFVTYYIGDVDSNGYFYIYYGATATFYVVDVNSNRSTFGYLVDPQNGFELDQSPYGVPISPLNIHDWAFSPNDGQLYTIDSTTGNVTRVNPINGNTQVLTTSPAVAGFGALFSDPVNNIYGIQNNTGEIYQYNISGNTATGKLFSQGVITAYNDGARCARVPVFGVIKSATPYVGVGDIITYTMSVKYYSNSTGTNVLFVDTIPTGATFVNNSLTLDGSTVSGNPNPPGATLPDLSSGQHTITFGILINTVPSPNPIPNTSTLSLVCSTGSETLPLSYSSNLATTTVINANITSTKSVDRINSGLGTTLTYTIVLKNTGNTSAKSIVFIDTVPTSTTFVTNSLKQDTTVLTGLTPNPPGVTLPKEIGGGKTSTITFQVRVATIPSPNTIPNNASAIYSFTITNTTVVKTGATNTNTVSTQVNNASLIDTKVADKNFATLNDIITYTITIANTGNISANAIIFKDTIPTGTTFVANSFTLNGVVKSGVSPAPPGVNIGTIPAGGISTVTFKVTVNTIPSPNRITNTATTTFTYQVDPSVVTTTAGSANSNIVTTTISRAALILPTKSVNLPGAFIGDTITYTIGFKNTGTTTANNIFFTDTTPNGTIFVGNSVKVNGVTITGGTLSPPPGVSIPDLGVNKSATLTFQVVVNTTPSPNPTTNIGTSSYSYTDAASGTSGTGVNNTNIVSTQIYPDNNPFKTVDKQYATVGDTLTYTLGWINALPVQQTNVTFVDTIPIGTTFVPNSVTVKGVSKPGSTVTAPNGINTLTLSAGQLVTVTFKVTINTIPSINPIPNDTTIIYSSTLVAGKQSDVSNIATTQVNYSSLSGLTKSVDKNFTTVGDTLTYTVTLANNGNTDVENAVFFDTIPNATSFIDGSYIVNGVTLPGENPNPPTGAIIGTIPAGEVTTIVFKVSVNTIPSPNSIPNTASLIGDYILDPVLGTTLSVGGNTNTVLSKVYFADLSNPIKGVDKVFSDIPTTLTYTITIVNKGNTTADNVVFVDTVPDGTNLVLNSVTVNGLPISSVSPNPPGVTIGTIPLGGTSTVTFKVTVNTIPTTNPIPNIGTVGYNFIVDPTLLTTSTGVYNTNTVYTTINHADLGNILKFASKLYGTCGDIIIYTISIPNTGNADALNVVLTDTVPNGTIYVPNSLKVDGNPIGGTPASINVGTVPAGNTSIVTFQVQVNC